MLLPSLACPAQCHYCFGPNRGPVMSLAVFDASIEWIAATMQPGQRLKLTFHGGEPLLAGKEWYRQALPALRQRFGDALSLGMQSNLWLLDDEFCEILCEHGISPGTSLDGPEAINDAQRGAGYYARTMAGIQAAQRYGMTVGVICTFTQLSAPYYREIFDFFAGQGLGFSVHEAVCGLGGRSGSKPLALSPQAHADLFIALFDYYLENITKARISTFDSMARGISAGQGGLCTFGECLGGYLTIAPDGGIFSCNRFAHHPEWRLGYVQDMPTLDDLVQSPIWQRLRRREMEVKEDCGECAHFDYCKGGCAYNAVSAGQERRDPHCEAYRRIFDHIADRALEQVFSEQNMQAVVESGPSAHGLLRKGPLLQIMRGGPHPQKVARQARQALACVALAASQTSQEAHQRLDQAGVLTQPERALHSLQSLYNQLHRVPGGLVNTYLHIIYACNLRCTHCYAEASPESNQPAMAVDAIERLGRSTLGAGFRKLVITGGEPLAHPQRQSLLDALAGLRQPGKTNRIVLRTNLAYSITDELLASLAHCADQIIVSLDGDQTTHDDRRGAGTFEHTVENLRRLVTACHQNGSALPPAQVGLGAVLPSAEIAGAPGQTVRALAEELGIPVRFKPLLPLGRAAAAAPVPEFYSSLEDDAPERIACSAPPTATCGLGMNLYIAPDGECYPCYALISPAHSLGNALQTGLPAILQANDRYRRVSVDSNQRCAPCSLRYLCGGFCRAWSINGDPDASPSDCSALFERARQRFMTALDILDIRPSQWLMAGLPLPE